MKLSRETHGANVTPPGPSDGLQGTDIPSNVHVPVPHGGLRDLLGRHGLAEGFEGLKQVMDRLLGEPGCPWDKVQTLATLGPYLLEEAYEVIDAMDDPEAHCGELGDVLFQIVFQAAIREREGRFDLNHVIESVLAKMIRRHPHVFPPEGDAPNERPKDAEEVAVRWEQIKARERPASAENSLPNPVASIPVNLPALQRAWRMQDKAASIGFDWPDVEGTIAKLREEWSELEAAHKSGSHEHVREELGDVLFVLVRVAQKLGIEPEDALRRANTKFERRFSHMMRRCHERGLDPARVGLDALERLWEEAKANEHSHP